MRVLIFSFVLSSCYCLNWMIPRWQTAGARGFLLCNGKPAARAFMLLCQKGFFSIKCLDVAAADKNGFFKISGTIFEKSMNPQLRIYSCCNRWTQSENKGGLHIHSTKVYTWNKKSMGILERRN
ncbi:unnamed protein product [Cylicocyclus nassatus]|uniref:Transthyretin-like family protein n=1 Tax=Cylicocyclus nassatus TaxID=53992 RepID=A0AA36MEF3_CYLNA|nr:unnamed protein product [Cylicocyclus nassatus]